MSLLLDALKKAALEKHRREQSSGEQSSGERLSGEKPKHEQTAVHAISPTPTPTPPPAPIKPAPSLFNVVVDSVDNVETAPSSPETVAEVASDIADENDTLVFDLDEIDSRYLDEILENKPTLVAVAMTDIPAVEPAEMMAPLATAPEPITPTIAAPDIALDTLFADAKISTLKGEDVKNPVPIAAPADASLAEQHSTSDVHEAQTSETHSIEQFTAAAGKTALAQLLLRSSKATSTVRKRIFIMYGMLTLTALTVLIFYYFLLQNNSASLAVNKRYSTAAVALNATADSPETGEAATSEAVIASEAVITSEAATTSEERDSMADSAVSNKPVIAQQETIAQQKTIAQKGSLGTHADSITANPLKAKPLKPKAVASEEGRRNRQALPPEFVAKQAFIERQNLQEDAVSESIARGYSAYQRGDLVAADAAYREALAEDPNQRDALLGAAAVAARQGRQQDALGFYQQRLARDPKDDYAQAGILALSVSGEQNPQLENELAKLLREYPNAAHLHFLQGSLYAARQQWDAAQLAFFEAWQRDTKNPDLAFNLAVALDHLHQPKEAMRFYSQALTLSDAHPVIFSKSSVERRLTELEGDAKQESTRP